MKSYSIFKDNNIRNNFESKKIDKDMKCDILIIGGGLTGISTYYHLNKYNNDIILVEQNEVGMSTTANSTGKITFLQDSIYNKLLNNFNFSKASKYLNSQLDAIELILNTIDENKIECDLLKSDSYVYTNKRIEKKHLYTLEDFLRKNNIEANIIEKHNETALVVKDTYLFNPVKFIYELIRNANLKNIFEHSSVKEIKKHEDYYECYVGDHVIKANKVVLASHYPYFLLPFLFPIKCKLEKSYLCAGKKELDNISLISYKNPFISIRKYNDYMIYLSCTHNNSCKVNDKIHFDKLLNKVKKYNLKVEYIWSNIDIMTNDNLPLIGYINKNMLIGTGYNTWGMTNAFLAGKIISDLIMNEENPYKDIFNPHRISMNNPIEIVKNGCYSAKGLYEGIINKNDKIEYKKIDGQEVAIYKDEKGEHIVLRKCPHMKCYLIFNEEEKTWDCPCHSSRFDIDGNCISSPSNKSIRYNNVK